MTLLEKYRKCEEPCIQIGDDVWCKIVRNGNFAEIAFEGTATVRGVLIDANFPYKIYKDEPVPWKVHRGFGDSFKTAIDKIAEILNGITELRVYAYSKGGAYGILMHEWATFHGISVRSFVFGAPAIIWNPSPEIKSRFKGLYNISIRGDWCSILARLLIGYKHVGHPIKIGPMRLDVWKNYHSKYAEYLADL